MPDEHTVAVVLEADAIDTAYAMGYDRFDEAPPEVDDTFEALSHYKETAEFINSVHPDLRALAGYVDSGPGTYTVKRKTVVVNVGNEDDSPMDGVQMDPQYVEDKLVRAFDQGALDSMNGDPAEPAECDATIL